MATPRATPMQVSVAIQLVAKAMNEESSLFIWQKTIHIANMKIYVEWIPNIFFTKFF